VAHPLGQVRSKTLDEGTFVATIPNMSLDSRGRLNFQPPPAGPPLHRHVLDRVKKADPIHHKQMTQQGKVYTSATDAMKEVPEGKDAQWGPRPSGTAERNGRLPSSGFATRGAHFLPKAYNHESDWKKSMYPQARLDKLKKENPAEWNEVMGNVGQMMSQARLTESTNLMNLTDGAPDPVKAPARPTKEAVDKGGFAWGVSHQHKQCTGAIAYNPAAPYQYKELRNVHPFARKQLVHKDQVEYRALERPGGNAFLTSAKQADMHNFTKETKGEWEGTARLVKHEPDGFKGGELSGNSGSCKNTLSYNPNATFEMPPLKHTLHPAVLERIRKSDQVEYHRIMRPGTMRSTAFQTDSQQMFTETGGAVSASVAANNTRPLDANDHYSIDPSRSIGRGYVPPSWSSVPEKNNFHPGYLRRMKNSHPHDYDSVMRPGNTTLHSTTEMAMQKARHHHGNRSTKGPGHDKSELVNPPGKATSGFLTRGAAFETQGEFSDLSYVPTQDQVHPLVLKRIAKNDPFTYQDIVRKSNPGLKTL